jgi:hypothetical protein
LKKDGKQKRVNNARLSHLTSHFPVVGERCVFNEAIPKGVVEDTQERMQE